EVFARYQPVAVIHLAGLTYVGESAQHPDLYYQINVGGTLSLLAEMRQARVPSIVFSSTAAVYGDPRMVPIPESHPTAPVNPYGRSKCMTEAILEDHAKAFGFRCAALRYFNAAGADPEGQVGESHDPETHLIPLVLQAALGVRASVTLYGDDYATPDGTCIRDYIHVTDLAEAHALALKRLLEGESLGPLNLGTGVGHSVRQVIETCMEVTGRDIRVEIASRRPGDPSRLVADPRQAQEILEWKPTFAQLWQIVETAWRWQTKSP
ncbi:MAG: UDP-glucose 4-epimerase GalE, partial [Candidatus Micrarchaeota archaeon]